MLKRQAKAFDRSWSMRLHRHRTCGAIRRALTLQPNDLAEFAQEAEILYAAARLVKPGGLIYAPARLPAENERQIEPSSNVTRFRDRAGVDVWPTCWRAEPPAEMAATLSPVAVRQDRWLLRPHPGPQAQRQEKLR